MSKKQCFVTVGATASFNELIAAVLAQDFLTSLSNEGYTDLLVQYGKGNKQLFDSNKSAISAAASKHNVTINGFELDPAGLQKYMLALKGNGTTTSEGVIISHAGSGTILDALRISVPIIVVPNATLLDNHQVELAEALAEQEYVVHGRIEHLGKALTDAEKLRQRHKEWPPVNSGQHRDVRGLKGVLDDEMGFLD